jgi:hypothetical protein
VAAPTHVSKLRLQFRVWYSKLEKRIRGGLAGTTTITTTTHAPEARSFFLAQLKILLNLHCGVAAFVVN